MYIKLQIRRVFLLFAIPLIFLLLVAGKVESKDSDGMIRNAHRVHLKNYENPMTIKLEPVTIEIDANVVVTPGESNHDKRIREQQEKVLQATTQAVGNHPVKVLAYQIAGEYGIQDQWYFIDRLAMKESGWNPNARNRSSGACGIPQALPCSKMGSHDVENQIRWFYGYTIDRYGSFPNALAFHRVNNWY